MGERIRMFSNGFEWECWDERNCSRCVKAGNPDEDIRSTCDLYDAITDSMVTDGAFAPEIAARFGWKPEYRAVLGWPCAEFQDEDTGPPPAAVEMAKAGAEPLPGFADPQHGGLALRLSVAGEGAP